MNEHENKKVSSRQIYCLLEQDFVDSHQECRFCRFWNGRLCELADRPRSIRRAGRVFRWAEKQLLKLNRRLARRHGRGLRLPPTAEKWPEIKPQPEEPSIADEEVEYGVAGVLPDETEEQLGAVKKKKDDFILPELIKEYWDVKPDVPDWGSESAPSAAPEPEPPVSPLPDDPQPGLLPPIGPDGGIENVPGGMPGPPPDSGGPNLP
jgi:hypothetical protein